jgi:hypothetical protein
MEAMAALSIAALVVQFVDFSTKLVKVAKLAYEFGTDHTPDKLDADVFIINLDNALHFMRSQYPGDQDFQDLVERCNSLGKDIKGFFLLQSTSTSKIKRNWRSIGAAGRHLWKRKDFEEKMTRLSQLEQLLRSRFTEKAYQ